MTHRVWLYFTEYAWTDVVADTYNEAQAIAWAWLEAGFPMGDARPVEITDWGR